MSSHLIVSFETQAQADAFMDWMSNSGEQDYFETPDMTDEPPENFVDSFEYDYELRTITGKVTK